VDYVLKVNQMVKTYMKPIGTPEFPAKTCRDLKLSYPDTPDGDYFLDPNRGSISDRFIANCRFTNGVSETCIKPTIAAFQKHKWVKSGTDGFKWFLGDINTNIGKMEYPASRSQLAFLRMEHTHAHQNLTYHCRNSHAHQDRHGRVNNYIKILSNNDVEMTAGSNSGFHLKVVADGCSVKDGKWHKTVFDVKPKDLEHLPIADVAAYDVAHDEEEFGLDVGPVCFH